MTQFPSKSFWKYAKIYSVLNNNTSSILTKVQIHIHSYLNCRFCNKNLNLLTEKFNLHISNKILKASSKKSPIHLLFIPSIPGNSIYTSLKFNFILLRKLVPIIVCINRIHQSLLMKRFQHAI